MPLRTEVFESLGAMLSDIHRRGQAARVDELVGQLRREFPDAELRRTEIEEAIIERASQRMIPVEFDRKV